MFDQRVYVDKKEAAAAYNREGAILMQRSAFREASFIFCLQLFAIRIAGLLFTIWETAGLKSMS